jgi:hypothetical protein
MRLFCCQLAMLLPRATTGALPPRPTILRGGGATATGSSTTSGVVSMGAGLAAVLLALPAVGLGAAGAG